MTTRLKGRKAIRAKNLSPLTERGYLSTARRWASWLAEQGYTLGPVEVRAHHVDYFIADIITATSAANGAHHYRNLRVFFGWLVKRQEMPLQPNGSDRSATGAGEDHSRC